MIRRIVLHHLHVKKLINHMDTVDRFALYLNVEWNEASLCAKENKIKETPKWCCSGQHRQGQQPGCRTIKKHPWEIFGPTVWTLISVPLWKVNMYDDKLAGVVRVWTLKSPGGKGQHIKLSSLASLSLSLFFCCSISPVITESYSYRKKKKNTEQYQAYKKPMWTLGVVFLLQFVHLNVTVIRKPTRRWLFVEISAQCEITANSWQVDSQKQHFSQWEKMSRQDFCHRWSDISDIRSLILNFHRIKKNGGKRNSDSDSFCLTLIRFFIYLALGLSHSSWLVLPAHALIILFF